MLARDRIIEQVRKGSANGCPNAGNSFHDGESGASYVEEHDGDGGDGAESGRGREAHWLEVQCL